MFGNKIDRLKKKMDKLDKKIQKYQKLLKETNNPKKIAKYELKIDILEEKEYDLWVKYENLKRK